MKDMLSLSQERFSARKFTSEAVSQEDLDYIMQCVQLDHQQLTDSLGSGLSSVLQRLRRNCRNATIVSGLRRLPCISWA